MTVHGPDNFTMTQDCSADAGGKTQRGTMSYRRVGEMSDANRVLAPPLMNPER